MTEVKAKLSNLRISPRKVRLAVDLVRGKKVQKAIELLSLLNKKSSEPLKKLIESAIANAKNNFGFTEDNLRISEIMVDEGATLKRWMPRARGRATTIRKRTSHINVVLTEIKETSKKDEKKIKKVKEVTTKKIEKETTEKKTETEKDKTKK